MVIILCYTFYISVKINDSDYYNKQKTKILNYLVYFILTAESKESVIGFFTGRTLYFIYSLSTNINT